MTEASVTDRRRTAPAPIAELLAPSSVAVIGASEDQGKFGGRVLQMLLKHRFAGEMYPINPNRATLLGLAAYKSVADTPGVPDVAIMAVPQPHVKARIEECAARGVKGAIVITSRFSDAGPEGAALEREIVEIARGANMRLIGPNCLGVISPANRLVLCSSPALDVESLPVGPVGFITQSGALMGTVFDRAVGMGVGLSHCVSVGNQADLELCDFIEFLIDDPATRVIASYVEGFKSPRRFVELAARARAAGKPWLIVKAGKTAAGSQAAFSHTASLAGDYAALEAVCRHENVILMDDVFAMLLLAGTLARHPGHRIRDIVLLGTSGGSGALTADRLSEAKVPLARFGAETRERLATVYVRGQADNPVDFFGAKVSDVPDFAYRGTRYALDDAHADAALVVITTAPNLAGMAEEVLRAGDEAGKPVMHVFQPARLANPARAVLAKRGVAFTDSIGEAVEALAAWHAWSAYEEPSRAGEPPGFAFTPPLAGGELGEAEAKALLSEAGIDVNEGVIVTSEGEARDQAARLGFPLVLKVVSPQVVHKTEVGGVTLDLRTADDVARALTAMRQRVQATRPDARIDGFLLQRMVPQGVELLLGARRDPQFGPMVTVGSGGVLVELLKDVVTLVAPVSHAEARAALRGLRIAPLLAGYRGARPVDVDAAADAIVRFGAIACRMGERDFEIEVNPLALGPAGCVALDARARFA